MDKSYIVTISHYIIFTLLILSAIFRIFNSNTYLIGFVNSTSCLASIIFYLNLIKIKLANSADNYRVKIKALIMEINFTILAVAVISCILIGVALVGNLLNSITNDVLSIIALAFSLANDGITSLIERCLIKKQSLWIIIGPILFVAILIVLSCFSHDGNYSHSCKEKNNKQIKININKTKYHNDLKEQI